MTGVISAPAAAATGLRAGTPVVGGGGDQAASAVGTGAVGEGIVSLSLGTSGVVFAATDSADRRTGRSPARFLPRRAGPLAPDGRHALGRRQSALVPRHAGPRSSLLTTCWPRRAAIPAG